MEQFEMLWLFQQEDMKADRIAAEIRKSPTRQKLEKNRDFILEQQKLYASIDERLANVADRLDIIREALPRCEEQLANLTEKIEKEEPATLEAVQQLMKDVNRCRSTIADFETEMKRLAKESTDQTARQRKIRLEAARAKQEFDAMKKSYDAELGQQKQKLDEQRAVAKEKAAGIDEKLMNEYNIIKKHTTPPMAKLLGDQCGGCNTSLPSAVLRKIKAGVEIIECETCGRMLIV